MKTWLKHLNIHLLLMQQENLLIIKEVMNNFLTCSVRIQVQNNQNKSRDSPPCLRVGLKLIFYMYRILSTTNE